MDALAAAALAEQPAVEAAPAPVAPQGTIDFVCPQCDEPIKVSVELAGKQTPCPECRRIIKVPVPQQEDKPRDWRVAAPRGPAAAALRRDAQSDAPAGAWGTAVSKSSVSRQALEEAEAIPQRRPGASVGQWIIRGVATVAAAAVVVFGALAFMHRRAERNQVDALEKALAFAPENGQTTLEPLAAAEVYRGAGAYWLRVQPLDREITEKALRSLGIARVQMDRDKGASAEHDARVIDLMLTQVDLGGEPEQVELHLRLPWDRVSKELNRTLTQVRSSDARVEMIRRVGHKLAEKNQPGLAATLAALSPEKEAPELLALVGLEQWRAGQIEAAEAQANLACKPFENKDSPKRPLISPSLVALLVALDKAGRAEKLLIAPPEPGKEPFPEARQGYAVGWALKDKWDDALKLAETPGSPTSRLETLTALAEVTLPAQAQPGRVACEKAFALLNGELKDKAVSSWLLWRLVRLQVQAGLAEQAGASAALITDVELRGRAQRDILDARLAREGAGAAELDELSNSVGRGDAGSLSQQLQVQDMARYLARAGYSADLLAAIEGWHPEVLRPFGYLGVALGQQER
jgi:hypothetical protein